MNKGAKSCRVWLYYETPPEFIGFGALGPSQWSTFGPINVITNMGVHRNYHGQPPAPDIRFSVQIIRDLMHEALVWGRSPLLGLYVHPQNNRARRLYESLGFQAAQKTYTDPDSGVVYQAMILDRLIPP